MSIGEESAMPTLHSNEGAKLHTTQPWHFSWHTGLSDVYIHRNTQKKYPLKEFFQMNSHFHRKRQPLAPFAQARGNARCGGRTNKYFVFSLITFIDKNLLGDPS